MKILVRLDGGLGDELCLTPVYRELKKKYSGSSITAFVKYRELLLHNPDVDILARIHRTPVDYRDYQKIFNMQWQTGKYLQNSDMHLVDFFAMQAGLKLENRNLYMKLVHDDFDIFRKLNIPKNRPVICFDAYANKDANRWGSKYFRELLCNLKKRHGAIIIQIGIASYGIPYVDFNMTRERMKPDIGIRQTAGLVRISDLYIGNNSGAAHIASAVKTPSVIIYGCTHASCYTHNIQMENSAFLDIDCQGCQNRFPGKNPIHDPKNFSCPEKNLACLFDLLPSVVEKYADMMLGKFYYSGKRNMNSPEVG
jgi:ADP-heptose:LPS heptosyltransferase